MKKTKMLFPFFLALYPVIGLYSRNLTEIQPWEIVRPIIIALAATGLLLWICNLILKDWERAALIVGLGVFFASASEISYRVVEGYLLHGLNESFHRVLILIAFLLIAFLGSRLVWDKYGTPTLRKNLVEYLNIVSVVLVLFPMINIGSFWIEAWDDAPSPWSTYVGKADSEQSLSTDTRPDIYYIILDGYGRGDILQQLYAYDNSEFLDALKERGFFIGDESNSNYLRTSLSITSALNMEYINFAAKLAGKASTNRIPMFELASNNRTRRLLQQAGYKFVLIDSGSAFTRFYDADFFVTPYKTRPNLFEMWFYSTTSLNALYEPELPVSSKLREYLPLAGYTTHRAFIIKGIENLEKAPAIPGPKFVFAHVIAPHPPFVLNVDGSPLRPNYPYVTGDGATFVSNREAYKNGYIGQIEYLNDRILQTIDAIIENSPQEPVIIIQGDHGPGLMLMQGDTIDACLWERASILNAYHFPGQDTHNLYPSISPINSFRTVFNTYFSTSFSLLDDKTFYSLFDFPYDFREITGKVKQPCGTAP